MINIETRIRAGKGGRVYVKVSPRSARNEVIKISEGEYKVRITAPPVDNAANEMLVDVLAEYFDVSKSQIQVVGGRTAKTKIVDIL